MDGFYVEVRNNNEADKVSYPKITILPCDNITLARAGLNEGGWTCKRLDMKDTKRQGLYAVSKAGTTLYFNDIQGGKYKGLSPQETVLVAHELIKEAEKELDKTREAIKQLEETDYYEPEM